MIKFIKKNLLFIFVTMFSILVNFNSASANALKTTQTPQKSKNTFSPTTPGGTQHHVTIRAGKDQIEKEIEKIKERLFRHNIIMDGGKYGSVARIKGYEVHHLISSSFCRKHPDLISVNQAPALSIPIVLHKLTGSHPASGRSKEYLEKEETLYNETNSLRKVYLMGLKDLERALKLYTEKCLGMDDYNVKSEITNTPVKNAQKAAEIASLKKKVEKKGGSENNPLIPKTLFDELKCQLDFSFLDSEFEYAADCFS